VRGCARVWEGVCERVWEGVWERVWEGVCKRVWEGWGFARNCPSESRTQICGMGSRAQESGTCAPRPGVQGAGCRVQGAGCRVHGFKVQGSGSARNCPKESRSQICGMVFGAYS